MYTKDNFTKAILEKFPDFKKDWEEHVEYWKDGSPGICTDMGVFSDYVADLIENEDSENLKNIFDLIEDFMINGDADIKNAAATCFLENLMNITGERISAKSYIYLLGKESKEYCKAWDDFTGVKTEGLWE